MKFDTSKGSHYMICLFSDCKGMKTWAQGSIDIFNTCKNKSLALVTFIFQDSLKHIRWLLQKDNLGQDSFLIGPPGPRRRWLALAFAELNNREVSH